MADDGNNSADKPSSLYAFGQPGLTTRVRRLETGAQRTRRIGLQPSAGEYGRIPSDALDSGTKGRVATYRTAQSKIGSVTPATNRNGFAYTSTDQTITWYWDGTNGSMRIVLHRADRTNFVIPITGSGLTISGLTASTAYYFLPFWSPLQNCTVGWVPGTHGTPQIAFIGADISDPVNGPLNIIQQNYQDREPITSGYMQANTAAGGGSGGGGGGGGNCIMAGTDIETLGGFPHQKQVFSETRWIKITVKDGRSLVCTYDHPVYEAVCGKITADRIGVRDVMIMDNGECPVVKIERLTRVCSKWKITMKEGHLFWANGFLSHNIKP